MTKGFSGFDCVHPGMCEFAAQSNQLGLLCNGHSNVGLREDGDHVSSLKLNILGSVVLQHKLTQIEWDQRRLQGVGVKALDDRVVPVKLRSQGLNLGSLNRT